MAYLCRHSNTPELRWTPEVLADLDKYDRLIENLKHMRDNMEEPTIETEFNPEEGLEQQTGYTEQLSFGKLLEDDEPLPEVKLSIFLDKKLFIEPATCTIEGYKINNFGKPALVLTGSKPEHNGELAISNKNQKMLQDMFHATTAGHFKGRKVKITAKPFKGTQYEGYELVFEKA